jgi:hypothetical protein
MRVLIAVLLLGPACRAQYGPESFAAHLEQLDRAIDENMATAASGLPEYWYIDSDGHSYAISSAPLKARLQESHSASAKEWVAGMRRQVRSFSVPEARNGVGDAAALQAVLARPEFKAVAEATALELFWQRLRTAIAEWLERLFAYALQHPTGTQALFWTLIAAVVLGLGRWLWVIWERTDDIPHVAAAAPLEQQILSWQEWLKAAREASAKGDHRQAVRCGYWSAVARLQQDRALRINLADTPRERLRLLGQATRRSAALPETQLEPLKGITMNLERYWYAKLPVQADDVARTFDQLEALGCKAD